MLKKLLLSCALLISSIQATIFINDSEFLTEVFVRLDRELRDDTIETLIRKISIQPNQQVNINLKGNEHIKLRVVINRKNYPCFNIFNFNPDSKIHICDSWVETLSWNPRRTFDFDHIKIFCNDKTVATKIGSFKNIELFDLHKSYFK